LPLTVSEVVSDESGVSRAREAAESADMLFGEPGVAEPFSSLSSMWQLGPGKSSAKSTGPDLQ
jgi:hypothetical protein